MLVTKCKLNLDFNSAQTKIKTSSSKLTNEKKKLTTMTPLQILCSFQTWNAKPVADSLRDKLAR